MAGYTQGATQELLSSTVTVSAGSSDVLVQDDIDLTDCAYAWMFIDAMVSTSATDGVELRLRKKTGLGTSETTAQDPTYIQLAEVGASNQGIDMGEIIPGIYALYATNNDSTYDATIIQIRVNKFTYA